MATGSGTHGHGTIRVGEPLPAVLILSDLANLLGFTLAYASTLAARGEFAHLEMTPRIGSRARYSGKKVQAWIDGESSSAPPSRYFRKGSR